MNNKKAKAMVESVSNPVHTAIMLKIKMAHNPSLKVTTKKTKQLVANCSKHRRYNVKTNIYPSVPTNETSSKFIK